MRAELRISNGIEVVIVPPDRPFVVGRGTGADLRLGDPRVSRRHLMLEPTEDGWAAVDISANGTWAEGRRVQRVALNRTVLLSLGAANGPQITLLPGQANPTPLPVPAANPPVPVAAPQASPAPSVPPVPPAIRPPVGPPASTVVSVPPMVPGPPVAPGPPMAPAPVGPPGWDQPQAQPPPDPADASEHHDQMTLRVGDHRPKTGPMMPPHQPASGPGLPPTGPEAGRTHALRPGRMLIGRALSNDIIVGDLLASREHAELFFGRSGLEIVDLGSANGTFVNGRRVDRTPLRPGDLIAIGHHIFSVELDRLVEYLDTGDVKFEVDGLCVDIGGTRLLHDISFRLPGSALLAVIGPSGAGKSTLLNALTGFRPATEGTVRYAGRDLYAQYDELRRRIGYVPQDDILHTTLTVRQALEYGAQLRFPAETTKDERRTRIEAVLAELGLTGSGDLGLDLLAGLAGDGFTDAELGPPEGPPAAPDGQGGPVVDLADRQVKTLSGGQRKRTSVALELLTQPTLLYLDEPTSGLDPGLDLEVMESLRRLADGGRTVVVTTHSVAQLDLCDYVLVLAKGGRVAYFGPPQHALPFLGASTWSQAFRALGTVRGAAAFARRYRASPYYVHSSARVPQAVPPEMPGLRQQSVLSQMLTLSRRYLRVIASDRSYLRLLIAYPFVLGVIPRIIDPSMKLTAMADGQPNRNAALVLLVLVLCGIFLGASSSVREIVKEREIYRRERGIGLSITAYLGSKVAVLTLIVTAQAVIFTMVGVAGRTPPDGVLTGVPLLEIMIVVALATVASAMMGLVISALVDNADKTMPMLVLLAMSQLLFTGAFMPLADKVGLNQLSFIFPARWGYAACASVTDIIRIQMLGNERLNPGTVADPFFEPTTSAYLLDLGGLVGISVVSIVATGLLLRRLDPRVARRR
ncbi:ATP-binding cassette domain-containing protein [Frankia sp. CNm7]|uniref:ATP-binding cassette domain-containing protein n=1 Tax=Frankia nepalensis TaxID=1836974 RepID=A0A937RBQ2_9ACTN|nr:FHA domain-containing protein [Frankia nepalensis]MBL7501271.1 ATP-binding cassette domain-containing protein [Frankia nepalensis]MBL7510118.1 ATP-binding cassette domain-containing protein [Frankia nepalensis]MBL7523857.1 ATP-binding cassette domain-containing protein [Frankia nepalensis]MBL7627352.1 ATP-binding cassette domain-containing protein [Frankia nepalensis]